MHNYTSTSSWMIVASAIILIGATYLAPRHQPTTLRPFDTEQTVARPLSPDSVQARLWQDPIEAGWKRIGATDLEDSNIGETFWNDWLEAMTKLKGLIDEGGQNGIESVFILPIVLSGKPNPETRERRLRSRFALQEAMEVMGYRPSKHDILNYFPLPMVPKNIDCDGYKYGEIAKGDKCKTLLKHDDYIPVTYETFEYIGDNNNRLNRQVFVFWIDSSIVNRGKTPNYRNIELLTTDIVKDIKKNVAILTLSGSDGLLKLIKSGEEKDLPEKLDVYYTSSTAPKKQFDKVLSKERNSSQIKINIEKKIHRTLPSDDYVLAAIIDELQRRIPEFGNLIKDQNKCQKKDQNKCQKKDWDEVWLLSEQDTFYSQVMTSEFKSQIKERKLEVNVKPIGFLKGIDGNLPDDSVTTKSDPANSINNLTDLLLMLDQSGVSEQRLFDRRQIDYLQRLAEKLLREERKKSFDKRVKAIGILGGDVYDKMLVLDVFRQYFPATNYFTTDLDSAYLYGPHAKVARNLIIGSAFGLSPTPHKIEFELPIITKGQVVFRDSYQTALYHSILKLIWPTSEPEKNKLTEVFNYNFNIGLYEVGRSQVHLLNKSMPDEFGTMSKDRYSWNYPQNLNKEALPSLENIPENQMPISIKASIGKFWLLLLVTITSAIILSVIWFLIMYVQKHKLLPEELGPSSSHFFWYVGKNIVKNTLMCNCKWWATFSNSFFAWGFGIFCIVFIATVLIFGPGLVNEVFKDLEPMYWLEGISAWPSVLLRFAIFLIGVPILASSIARNEITMKKLRMKLKQRDIITRHRDANLNYAETHFKGPLTRDFFIIFILTIILMISMSILLFVTMGYSDGFFTPGRGRWVFLFHEISLSLSLSTLLLLVWWAAFRHYRCRTFLVDLNKELHPRNPDEIDSSINKKEATSLSAPEINALEEYAGISSVTLLPPFAMMVLLIVSRHTMFDGWNIPFALVMSLSLMLFILLISAYQLSAAARYLKLTELNSYKIKAEPDMRKREAAEIAMIWESAAGPFGKYQQQPIIQALIFVAAGFGISFIEPMFQFFRI